MLHSLTDWISHYGSWAYFPLIYLESLGLPLPGESSLIIGSLLAASGKIHLGGILIATFCASVVGNATGYAIGYWGGRRLLNRFAGLLHIRQTQLDRFEKLLNEKGAWFIITARFIVIARQLNGVIAGAGGMNFPRFMAANIFGAALWTLAWGLGPYMLGGFL